MLRWLPSLISAFGLSVAARAVTPSEIVADASESAWIAIADTDLLVMDIEGGRQIIMQLAPLFSPEHVANIRKLAAAHWWDGTSVYRIQDNYVVQWGDKSEKKPLPSDASKTLPQNYVIDRQAVAPLITVSPSKDSYASSTGFLAGWPVAMNENSAWLTHCYGMVGAGRNLAPDAGNGAELYAVIGHAPRHLDRNIALIGRVIQGIEHLSSLPRGTETLGIYGDAQRATPILSVRLASDMPEKDRPHFQMMDTTSKAFADYAHARANREDAFFNIPAGGADICNIPVPIRP